MGFKCYRRGSIDNRKVQASKNTVKNMCIIRNFGKKRAELIKEMDKCTNDADRYRRNPQFSNETELTTEAPPPQAECLDQEMFHSAPCRKDEYGKITCDCRNFNFCAEDYIILVGNSISMVPLFLSIVILFSFP